MRTRFDHIVIGGGFFGCETARFLGEHGAKVLLLEREGGLLKRASLRNQARVHNGYHYPRSLLTALRSRVNYPRFLQDYAPAIDRGFDQYYAVARLFSKVSARQYKRFCERIEAPVEPAPEEVRALFNPDMVEDVFKTEEVAFDAEKLARLVEKRVRQSGVDIRLRQSVASVEAAPEGIAVIAEAAGRRVRYTAPSVLNCTYSRINDLHRSSGLPIVPLKHELAEVTLIHPPRELANAGVTVMCGPFFSLMPYPPAGLWSFTHVRYTPHAEWQDGPGAPRKHPSPTRHPRSAYSKMLADAKRYLPVMASARYVRSLWEVKTVLPQSEADDSRPILFRSFEELPGYACIMGGKLDNIYDVLAELKERHAGKVAA